MRAADAEKRLRYVQDVRRRTRHAGVIPVLVVGILGLGALIIAMGLLMLYWPHVAGIPAAWFLGASAAVLVAERWQAHRQRMYSGVLPARARPAVLAIMIAAEFVAHAIGTNIIIAGAGVGLSLAAWRAGMRTLAVAIAAVGMISEALVLQGTRQWAALLIFGTGLVAVGIMARQTSRHTV